MSYNMNTNKAAGISKPAWTTATKKKTESATAIAQVANVPERIIGATDASGIEINED